MLRSLEDILFSKNLVVRWWKHQSPKEEIVFASAAVLLETNDTAPVGWSFRRIFQHRGVVVITQNQIVFKNSLLSILAIICMVMLVLSILMLIQYPDWHYLPQVIILGLLAAQFRPFQKSIQIEDVQQINLKTVQGLFSTSSVLIILERGEVFQIVPAQLLSENVMQLILVKKTV